MNTNKSLFLSLLASTALALASGQALAASKPAVAQAAAKAPIALTETQMDKIVAGEVTCTGSGTSATCTDTTTDTTQINPGISVSETTSQLYAGASCNSGNIGTGQCNATGDPTITGFYFNNHTGNAIGKPYP